MLIGAPYPLVAIREVAIFPTWLNFPSFPSPFGRATVFKVKKVGEGDCRLP